MSLNELSLYKLGFWFSFFFPSLLYSKCWFSKIKAIALWYWLYQYSLASLIDGSKNICWSLNLTLWIEQSWSNKASCKGLGAKNSLSHNWVQSSNFLIKRVCNLSSISLIQNDIFEQSVIPFNACWILLILSPIISLLNSEFSIWDK